MNESLSTLREYLSEVLKEYWGELPGSVVRDQLTREELKQTPIPADPFCLDDKGVIVPKDAKKKIKKYFDDMGLTPTNKPGKTYK
jgi:hypothetical protein